MSDLLYSDPQWLEMMTQGWLTITAEALVCFCDRFRVFPSIATHGLSSKWHTVVLPGAISRLCSVSPRQIPVWTQTHPLTSQKHQPVCNDHCREPFLLPAIIKVKDCSSLWSSFASGKIQSNNQNKQINKTNKHKTPLDMMHYRYPGKTRLFWEGWQPMHLHWL